MGVAHGLLVTIDNGGPLAERHLLALVESTSMARCSQVVILARASTSARSTSSLTPTCPTSGQLPPPE